MITEEMLDIRKTNEKKENKPVIETGQIPVGYISLPRPSISKNIGNPPSTPYTWTRF